MPWINEVPVVVQDWYLGSYARISLAAILMGGVSSSGGLPFTFPVKLADCPAHGLREYAGYRGRDVFHFKSNEGVFVG
jgi:Glycosyl hydrolase family 3 C terminal domain.